MIKLGFPAVFVTMLRHGKIVLGDPPKDYDNPKRKFKQWHKDRDGD